jgi:hypothetical protein
MRQARRWVGWKYEVRLDTRTGDLKWSKVPYQVRSPTYKASSTNAKTWGTCAQAEAAYAHGDVEGIGFVLGDGWAGADLDHCTDPATGALEAWAWAEVQSLASYAEWSPSGTGVHILLHGDVHDGGHKHGGIEAYGGGRFFTVTGLHLAETPATVEIRQDGLDAFCARHFSDEASKEEFAKHSARRLPSSVLELDDEALIAKALAARNGEKFSRLWAGDTVGFPSRSEAVASLLCGLAFWTQRDAARMDHLFRRSGLMSDKWEEKRGPSTWGECEIANAIEYTSEVYEPVLCALPSTGAGTDASAARQPGGDDQLADEGTVSPDAAKTAEVRPGRAPSIAVQLVALAENAGCEFFHDDEREAWVTFPVGEHKETTRVSAGVFWDWLERGFHAATGRTANAAAKQEAQGVFRGRAKFDGAEQRVHVRLAEHDAAIYLDLADAARLAVKITSTGYTVVSDYPVRFWRPKGMLALPVPVHGGSLNDLRRFVNITDSEWPLLVGFLVECYRATKAGGHPVLAIGGEQGCAKSTLARIIRLLVDPNRAPLRAEPRDKRDLMITARNNRLLVFGNLSGSMQPWLSDSLCRISTGGGHATRMLYADAEEQIFDSTLPSVLTSIADVASKSDLVDRCVFLSLPRITEDKRREESAFWPELNAKLSSILGALLYAVATALAHLPEVKEKSLPRMADFARWVIAAEPALGWQPGTFISAYRENRAAANTLALDASLVGQAMLALIPPGTTWEGTSKDLLAALNALEPGNEKKPGWPGHPRSLSGAIRTIAPNLRASGFTVPDETKKARMGNVWTFTRAALEEQETPPPPPPPSSPGQVTVQSGLQCRVAWWHASRR